MHENKLISVIIPTYNRANFLPEAIESVNNQNYQNLEIIIVDDGSTDNTKDVISTLNEPRIKYIYQENKGPAAARNTGIKKAKGEIIGFLDSDDLWPENKLNSQLSELIDNKNIEIIMGCSKYILMDGVSELMINSKNDKKIVNFICLGSGLFRKSVFDKVGLFNKNLKYAEDHDWILRAKESKISIKVLDEITLYIRMHTNNMTHNRSLTKSYLIKALKLSIDRRKN